VKLENQSNDNTPYHATILVGIKLGSFEATSTATYH
jgi:hypothetical protein